MTFPADLLRRSIDVIPKPDGALLLLLVIEAVGPPCRRRFELCGICEEVRWGGEGERSGKG